MRIGEVSRRSGVSVRMLRHYEARGLVRPSGRTSAGYRDYAEEDLRRILHVEALRSLGLSLAEAGRALDGGRTVGDSFPDDPAPAPDPALHPDPAPILDALIARTRERLAAQQELLTRLEDTRGRAPQDWDDVLGTIALLRAVRSDDPGSRHALALAAEDVPPAALARAALEEDETNVAGALRWAARRDRDGADAVVAAATDALADADRTRRRHAVALLADQLRTDPGPPDAPSPARTRRTTALLLATAREDEDAEARVASALAVAAVPAQLAAGQRDELRDLLLALVVDGVRDVEAAEGLGRLSAVAESEPAGASAVVDGLLRRLREEGVPAAGRLRLLQAAGELPAAGLRRVLEACADEADPDAARILTYLSRRPEAHGGTDSTRALDPTTIRTTPRRPRPGAAGR